MINIKAELVKRDEKRQLADLEISELTNELPSLDDNSRDKMFIQLSEYYSFRQQIASLSAYYPPVHFDNDLIEEKGYRKYCKEVIKPQYSELDLYERQRWLRNLNCILTNDIISLVNLINSKRNMELTPTQGHHLFVGGDSGSGKTTTFLIYYYLNPKRVHPEYTEYPVIMIEAPSNRAPRELFKKIINAFGEPTFPRESEGDLSGRAIGYIISCRTKVLIIDEAHNLKDELKFKLKGIANRCPQTTIVLGTVDIDSFFAGKDMAELRGRWKNRYQFGRYHAGIKTKNYTYESTIATLLKDIEVLLPFPEFSCFSNDFENKKYGIEHLIVEKTGGILKDIIRVIRTSADYALTKEKQCVDYESILYGLEENQQISGALLGRKTI